MARELEEHPSNIASWKRVDRIPSDKQSRVLERGIALGLPISAELVIYPSGRIPEVVARSLPVSHAPCPASDHEVVGCAASANYGNRSAVLDNSAHMVAA